MKYYKTKWNESRGDQFDSWGHSWWYLEIGEDDYPNRQIEIYDNGRILKYSQEHLADEFGGLGDQKFELSEIEPTEFKIIICTKMEFENHWNK